ncbi:MAG: AAA family ATPase [Candidatus Aminicenantes bacterium]|nr:MAG: AAA family ATPase [Candidatus Aminicenantes bacterium]
MKREIEEKLQTMLADKSSNNVIIVEGARQVGKSYLVNHVLKSQPLPYFAYDLEKEKKLRRQIDETEDFPDFKALMYDQYGLIGGSILFFDEAQESKNLANYVKSFKEDWPEICVILTGSSMNRFFSKDTRIPVGRSQSITVFSFSFPEFVQYIKGDDLADFLRSAPDKVPGSRHQFLLELFDRYMKVGGYPEAVIAYKNEKSYFDIIDEIMAGLEEDFQRKEEYEPELFRNVVQGVSNNIGSPSKFTHFDTTKYRAKKVIEAMKGWHIVLEVEHYSFDPQRSNFLPKRYLHDIGVVNRKRSLAVPSVSILETIDPLLRIPLGGLFENAVLLNLVKGESARFSVGTWKKGGNTDIEVDFVMDIPEYNVKIPIECKAALNLKSKHYKNIIHYLRLTGQGFGVVVSAAPLERIVPADQITIMNIPVYLAGKENIKEYFKKSLK